ncbi:protein of unknown function [Nocardia amikacinitolerans]|uniref:DUF1707 domain-containing protein n=1 Tax=Nocardia amikacinitolerans TaxID=756689 RepID=A0A285LVQ1_9NOCA|nr:DUF1707 domain-containing protein [Nocardia amikacinitolerans]MCP2280682.1 protein of unknown function (DUF1707) [Nocardia amikacinitolerans]MCP2300094.1 protein of unknown function (DUF1707) [Nocardia amikacinitolerans]MCP2316984.1 protein of unknown function (DUF1707) [Nocardia amikacinitolerans]SNY88543.1 protein of unknown function [Nocardia amikacinitolerans]
MDISPGTRASDAERDQVVRLLGRHMADGRLDLAEYDQRVARVYGTTTRDDLQLVLSDLPKLTKEAAAPPKSRPRIPVWQRIEGGSWLGVSILVLVIWAAISIGVGEFTYPWPIWVIGPWGAVLVFRMLTGWESGHGCKRAG